MNMLEAPFRVLGQIGPRLIMIAAMVTSYDTQHRLFLSWGVDGLSAAIAPAVVDLLAITCAEILHDQWVIRGKGSAGFVLAVAGLGSAAANWLAGVTIGSKVVHASMVLAYVLAELVVGRVRRATEQQKAAAQAVTPEVTADEAASPDLSVSLAPRPARKRTIAERMAAGEAIEPSARTDRRYRQKARTATTA